MKLTSVRVQNYKSIDDSGVIKIDTITALVGKNESGKTSLLNALARLSPVPDAPKDFNYEIDYPRKSLAKYKREHEDTPANVVTAEFELTDEEVATLEEKFGQSVIKSRTVKVSKGYDNQRSWALELNEVAAVKHILSKNDLGEDFKAKAKKVADVAGLVKLLDETPDRQPSAETLLKALKARFKDEQTFWTEVRTDIVGMLPLFVYFDDYSTMEGRISIDTIKNRVQNPTKLTDSDRTFLALLELVDADVNDFAALTNYERIRANLESSGNEITDELFRFWSQNKELAVEFDLKPGHTQDDAPFNSGMIFHVRVKNQRHRVTVPFDNRSRGFVWFFSFLVYFSRYKQDNRNLVLLLDEPGLSLHAKAQADFLRFMDERLAPKHQVVYTTHSPFLIDASKFARVRTVEDRDNAGTVVSGDVLHNDRDTLFPLQAALGYEMAQTLFVGPNTLLVEGPSELIYLPLLSEAAQAKGLVGLDRRWVLTPVGGADKVATFLSLLGANQLNVAVLLDVSNKDKQRFDTLQKNGSLRPSHLIPVSSVTEAKEADIEDIFHPGFYLKLVNAACKAELGGKIAPDDIATGSPRIVKRIEEHYRKGNLGVFSHLKPATYLLREQTAMVKDIDDDTLKRASTLFEKLNALLPAEGAARMTVKA